MHSSDFFRYMAKALVILRRRRLTVFEGFLLILQMMLNRVFFDRMVFVHKVFDRRASYRCVSTFFQSSLIMFLDSAKYNVTSSPVVGELINEHRSNQMGGLVL